ncbi:vacuolar CLN3 [Scheffersomyces xylosifermentans]|uniref:vacuolar CLN3 n=1 Tax=Scheffersomyces xylosifermentans TaxID=1304137 RepID=UPI00315D4B76
MMMLSESRKLFVSFFMFGLLNNILYVVILSAAIDLVGASTPKAVVLLADVVPSFVIKASAPFFIHLIPYIYRIWSLVSLSSVGMLLLSTSSQNAIGIKVFGILLASLSSGLGEVTFLQLTHYYNEEVSLGGFSSGTGGAGLFGSFIFMLLTNMLGIKVWIVLLLFSIVPVGFLVIFYLVLPSPTLTDDQITYQPVNQEDNELGVEFGSEAVVAVFEPKSNIETLKAHIYHTLTSMRPLLIPYMLPLCSVYVSEYVINQGISPTLLFPLEELPSWLFSTYRDLYVVYGFLYQLGVFISRSSINFGIRIRRLYWLSVLQFINVIITLSQSMYDFPFSRIWLLLVLIFYEGLLGGFSYVNTFISVSQDIPRSKREFSMGCVTISDSLGIVLAGSINWWLETKLCGWQVDRGRDWCLRGDSA